MVTARRTKLRYPSNFSMHQAKEKSYRSQNGCDVDFDNREDAIDVISTSYEEDYVIQAIYWLIYNNHKVLVPFIEGEIQSTIPTIRSSLFSRIHRKRGLIKRIWKTEAEDIKKIEDSTLEHIDEITLNQLANIFMRLSEFTADKDPKEDSKILYEKGLTILKKITPIPTDVSHTEFQVNPEIMVVYRIPDAPLLMHFEPQTASEWLVYFARVVNGATNVQITNPFELTVQARDLCTLRRFSIIDSVTERFVNAIMDLEDSTDSHVRHLLKFITSIYLQHIRFFTLNLTSKSLGGHCKYAVKVIRNRFDLILKVFAHEKVPVYNPLVRTALFLNQSILDNELASANSHLHNLLHIHHRGEDIRSVFTHYMKELETQLNEKTYEAPVVYSNFKNAIDVVISMWASIDHKYLPLLRQALEMRHGSTEIIELCANARNLELSKGRYSYQDICDDEVQNKYKDMFLDIALRSANERSFHKCPTNILSFNGCPTIPKWYMRAYGYNDRISKYVEKYIDANKSTGFQDASRYFCLYKPTSTDSISVGGKKEVVPANFAVSYKSRIMDCKSLLRCLRSTLSAGINTKELFNAWMRALCITITRATVQKNEDLLTLTRMFQSGHFIRFPFESNNFKGMVTAQTKASASVLSENGLFSALNTIPTDSFHSVMNVLFTVFPIYFSRTDVRSSIIDDIRNCMSTVNRSSRVLQIYLPSTNELLVDGFNVNVTAFNTHSIKKGCQYVGQKDPFNTISSITKTTSHRSGTFAYPLIGDSSRLVLYYLNSSDLKSEEAYTMTNPYMTYIMEIIEEEIFKNNNSNHSLRIEMRSATPTPFNAACASDSAYVVLLVRHLVTLWVLRRINELVEEKFEKKESTSDTASSALSSTKKNIFNISEVQDLVHMFINYWNTNMVSFINLVSALPKLVSSADGILSDALNVSFQSLATFNERFTLSIEIDRNISLLSKMAAGVARADVSRVPGLASSMSCAKPVSRESYNWVQAIIRNIPRHIIGEVFIETLEKLTSQKFTSLTSTRCIIESLFDACNRLVDASTILTALCKALTNPTHAHITILLWEETISRILEYAKNATDKEINHFLDQLPKIRKAFDFETLTRFVDVLQPWVNSTTKGLLTKSQTTVVYRILEKVFCVLVRSDYLGTQAFSLFSHPVVVSQKRFQKILSETFSGVMTRSNIFVPNFESAIAFSVLFSNDFVKTVETWARRERTRMDNNITQWMDGNTKPLYKPSTTQKTTFVGFGKVHREFDQAILKGLMIAVSYMYAQKLEDLSADKYNLGFKLEGVKFDIDRVFERIRTVRELLFKNIEWLSSKPLSISMIDPPLPEYVDVLEKSIKCIPENPSVIDYYIGLISNHSQLELGKISSQYVGLYQNAVAIFSSIMSIQVGTEEIDLSKYNIRNYVVFSHILRALHQNYRDPIYTFINKSFE